MAVPRRRPQGWCGPRVPAGGVGSASHILGSATQYNIAAGSLPLDLAKGRGDQGIFEEEEGPRVVKNEDVVLGGQEAAVAMG